MKAKPFPDSGTLVDYHLCPSCGHCFAPEFQHWSKERFGKEIYNEQYAMVDPDYAYARPTGNANLIESLFGREKGRIRHLDYGGGSGLLSGRLRELGWDSTTYDPFGEGTDGSVMSRQYDLVTAFEVFEHVPDHSSLFADLRRVAHEGTVILFSTLLSDGQIFPGRPLDWWYASPRNGHVSLFSSRSLSLALAQEGFNLKSLDAAYHLAYRNRPDWSSPSIP